MIDKPYAPSCDRNREPILAVLNEHLNDNHQMFLEMGAGTGQHAIYLAPEFPSMRWVVSDREENHQGIQMWLKETPILNIRGPLSYELGKDDFPDGDFDVVFTANTLHIMSWDLGQQFLSHLGENLRPGALVIIYGPFNYGGNYTSDSNGEFDKWLKDRDPSSAIRNFEDIEKNLQKGGFQLVKDHEMPANNRMLVFAKNQ